MKIFSVTEPSAAPIPIILSIPHCGSLIPDDLRDAYRAEKIRFIDDTDWFVDRLYSFAPQMGITVLAAAISRWVIDLNRHPSGKPLYSDGRVITGLCPTTDFNGDPLYADQRKAVDPAEVHSRIETYYEPYHREITRLMDAHVERFGKVLLWECHSIRRFVPTIHRERFPDLIVGDADGTSASLGISEVALHTLEASGYLVSHNHPFKGGWITRHYANPGAQRHVVQLEMAKDNYMDDSEKHWSEERAGRMQDALMRTMSNLAGLLAGD